MKIRFRSIAAFLILSVALAAMFVISLPVGAGVNKGKPMPVTLAMAQKSERASSTEVNIDAGVAPLTGKQVYYFLTDAEGGDVLEATGQTRKVPAWILYNYRGKRDKDGHLVSPLLIGRPAWAGGIFQRDEVAQDSARTPGYYDTRQPGDLRN